MFNPAIGRLGSLPLGCEETEFCLRASRAAPDARIALVSGAEIDHHVPAARATVSYLLRRCYFEGISKALVRRLGDGRSLDTERTYLRKALPARVKASVRRAARRARRGGSWPRRRRGRRGGRRGRGLPRRPGRLSLSAARRRHAPARPPACGGHPAVGSRPRTRMPLDRGQPVVDRVVRCEVHRPESRIMSDEALHRGNQLWLVVEQRRGRDIAAAEGHVHTTARSSPLVCIGIEKIRQRWARGSRRVPSCCAIAGSPTSGTHRPGSPRRSSPEPDDPR